jgi:hypothetical protein
LLTRVSVRSTRIGTTVTPHCTNPFLLLWLNPSKQCPKEVDKEMAGGAAGGFVSRAFDSMLKECSGKKYPDLQKAIQSYLGWSFSFLILFLKSLSLSPATHILIAT